jgi:hypothetical protein
VNALFAWAFSAIACCLASSETKTPLRDMGCTVGEGTEEGGVDDGDDGGDDEISLIVQLTLSGMGWYRDNSESESRILRAQIRQYTMSLYKECISHSKSS